jgi:hypothetical protein
MIRSICFAVAAAAVLAVSRMPHAFPAEGGLPARLDRYLTTVVELSPERRAHLLRGEPIVRLLDGEASKEVAVFGAVWIDAPARRYTTALQDIENFERGGGFKVTKRISTPPRLEDFALLRLPAEDIEDLRTCRPGDCSVKLGASALQRFRTEIDWKSGAPPTEVNALMRELALEYVKNYLEGGNDRLAVYHDNPEPTVVADEFRALVDRLPDLTASMPDVRRYLLEYPKVSLPEASSFLYWQETVFGLKPTIRITHVTIREGAEDSVAISKMLYATHYFWSGIELRVLLPDASRGQGFWFVTVNRSRADGLSGVTGTFVRGRVRDEVQEGVLAGLRATKKRLEQRH